MPARQLAAEPTVVSAFRENLGLPPETRKRGTPKLGVIMGRPSSATWRAPPPMAPVDPTTVLRPNVTSTGVSVEHAVERLLNAYEQGKWNKRNQKTIESLSEATWATISRTAVLLLQGGCSLEGFVLFVRTAFRKQKGRAPFLMEVLGPKAVTGWLPQYVRRAREVLPSPTYQATPERRRVWQEWIYSARQLNHSD